jgi:Cof subfamily protein (haloacid dehalogenase superfamily)
MPEPKIELIVVDLDATLLNNKSELSERNETALKKALENDVKVILATGKTYASARDIITRLGLTTPGIFSQGLIVHKADGSIQHQQTLDPLIARQVITFAEDRGFTVVAYAGNRLLTRTLTPAVEKLNKVYHEPPPEGIGPLQNILDEMQVNKLLLIRPDEPQRIKALRWQLDRQLDGKARLMQAMLKDMLEVLPAGASKGTTLRVLLREIGVDASQVLAIGDGENDLEMIQMAGIGVAVGNADESLKAAADHVVSSNEDHGVAEAIERFVLGETPANEDKTATSAEEETSS